MEKHLGLLLQSSRNVQDLDLPVLYYMQGIYGQNTIFAKRLDDAEEEYCFSFISDGDAESIPHCISKALELSYAKSTWTILAETGSSN